ncbi:penicillin-binding transpeptidase domain-containing protein [Nannocystis exedens]|nr:penicillin-binding transpeptidase domain-containing protein [Nannocystis exedens]
MRAWLLIVSLLLSACARPTPAVAPPIAAGTSSPAPQVVERVDGSAQPLFAAAQVEGVFVLRSLTTGEQIVTDAALAGTGELPASTFKIPNALIGLERGVLAGADATLKWDGVERAGPPAWNRDHSLASALRDSTVWFFQEVARRVGPAAMHASLRAFAYGNADIGGGIDRFWLQGALRISPREQVEFISRLHRRELPVAREHMALVEHMLTRAQAPGWSWRGKTGLTAHEGRAVGWLVGLAERDGTTWAYALLLRAPEAEEERLVPVRAELTRALLIHYGALPAEAGR